MRVVVVSQPSWREDSNAIGQHAHNATEYGAAEEGDEELPGCLANAELAGDGGGDRELEADDARGVVEQRFAFEHADLALRQRGLMAQRAHGDRIGGAERGAERQCSGQREHGPERVQRESDDHHREDGQTDGERQ